VTIRSAFAKTSDPLCIHSVIVFWEGYNPKDPKNKKLIDAVITKHLQGKSVAGKVVTAPTGFIAEDSLRQLEVL
jgi:hypothetical protein